MPDITLLLLGGLLVVMIFFTWRNSKKRKADAEEMQAKLLPGAEIMTTQGIFGTLISIDDDSNEAIIESTPGTLLRVHRQTISRVVEPELEPLDDDVADDEADAALDAADAATTDDSADDSTDESSDTPRKKSSETE
jgi:preprotein translocase subunit YajC